MDAQPEVPEFSGPAMTAYSTKKVIDSFYESEFRETMVKDWDSGRSGRSRPVIGSADG